MLVGAGAAALVLVVLVVWLAVRGGGEEQPRESAQSGGAAVTSGAPATAEASSAGASEPSGEASQSQSPSGGATEVPAGRQLPPMPAGWIDYHDPTGFSVFVPAGWNRSKEGSIMYFRDPASGRILGIDQTNQPRMDPVADWRGQAQTRVARGDFPNYAEVHIQPVDYFVVAADWEFTFDRRGVRKHVNNRGVVTSPTQAYGFYWETTDADWAAARAELQVVFDSFRPRA